MARNTAKIPPSNSARTALMVTVAGWFWANGWSQPGMVDTGTRAELAKKRMNMGRREAIWAVWGSFTASPIAA
jgi:hypothetical protein